MNINKKKASQLGMPAGTAFNRLKKNIIFFLLKRSRLNICHRCNKEISSEADLSLDHIIPWLNAEDPIKLFFDLENIAFSHLKCNSAAARQPRKGEVKHPSLWAYKKGCRCQNCVKLKKNSYDR